MKRTPKPFVIERKRRARTPAAGDLSIWSGAAGRTLRQLVHNDDADTMTARPTTEPRHDDDASPPTRAQVRDNRKPRVLEAQCL